MRLFTYKIVYEEIGYTEDNERYSQPTSVFFLTTIGQTKSKFGIFIEFWPRNENFYFFFQLNFRNPSADDFLAKGGDMNHFNVVPDSNLFALGFL